jgi:hypothetical protein
MTRLTIRRFLHSGLLYLAIALTSTLSVGTPRAFGESKPAAQPLIGAQRQKNSITLRFATRPSTSSADNQMNLNIPLTLPQNEKVADGVLFSQSSKKTVLLFTLAPGNHPAVYEVQLTGTGRTIKITQRRPSPDDEEFFTALQDQTGSSLSAAQDSRPECLATVYVASSGCPPCNALKARNWNHPSVSCNQINWVDCGPLGNFNKKCPKTKVPYVPYIDGKICEDCNSVNPQPPLSGDICRVNPDGTFDCGPEKPGSGPPSPPKPPTGGPGQPPPLSCPVVGYPQGNTKVCKLPDSPSLYTCCAPEQTCGMGTGPNGTHFPVCQDQPTRPPSGPKPPTSGPVQPPTSGCPGTYGAGHTQMCGDLYKGYQCCNPQTQSCEHSGNVSYCKNKPASPCPGNYGVGHTQLCGDLNNGYQCCNPQTQDCIRYGAVSYCRDRGGPAAP